MHVGRKVRERREEKKIDRAALAQALGITDAQLERYERGDERFPPKMLSDIAENLLNTSVDEFFKGFGG